MPMIDQYRALSAALKAQLWLRLSDCPAAAALQEAHIAGPIATNAPVATQFRAEFRNIWNALTGGRLTLLHWRQLALILLDASTAGDGPSFLQQHVYGLLDAAQIERMRALVAVGEEQLARAEAEEAERVRVAREEAAAAAAGPAANALAAAAAAPAPHEARIAQLERQLAAAEERIAAVEATLREREEELAEADLRLAESESRLAQLQGDRVAMARHLRQLANALDHA